MAGCFKPCPGLRGGDPLKGTYRSLPDYVYERGGTRIEKEVGQDGRSGLSQFC